MQLAAPFRYALCTLVFLIACNDDSDPASPADGKPDAGDEQPGKAGSGAGERDAMTDPDEEPDEKPDEKPDAGEDPMVDPGEGEEVMDRCFGGDCENTFLPPQPDLEFLEDMGDGWKRLMEVDWALAGNSEGYRCKTFTLPQDVYITAFKPQSPVGTHHSTYGISDTPSGKDEVYACGVGNQGERRLQGSGAGTGESQMPEGVVFPLRKGEQIFMNLHLFNVNDEVLEGRSGMWVKTVPAGSPEIVHEAEAFLAGPLMLDIPVGRSTTGGPCTLRSDATIFQLAPHMHQKGVHLRATLTKMGTDEPIEMHDGEYDFFDQKIYPVGPFEAKQGDRIDVECTYENDTGGPLRWGDSSLDEMCFISVGIYPAIGYGALPCSN